MKSMLQMVARFFAFPDDKILEGMAFAPLMTMAIRPLAEIARRIEGHPALGSESRSRHFKMPLGTFCTLIDWQRGLYSANGWNSRVAIVCAEVQKSLQPEHQQAGERLTFISKNVNFIASRLKTAVAQAKAGEAGYGSRKLDARTLF